MAQDRTHKWATGHLVSLAVALWALSTAVGALAGRHDDQTAAGWPVVVLLLVTGAAVALAMPGVLMALRALSAVDSPTARSSHDRPTLRGGGLAALVVVPFVASFGIGQRPPAWLAGCVALGVLGLVEDVRPVPPLARLVIQVGSAVILGVMVANNGGFGWPAFFVVAAVAIWLTFYVNAFNFMDGINGISGAHVAIAAVCGACTRRVTASQP